MHECNQGGKERYSGYERLCAIDWIEYPNEVGIVALAAIFFTDDTVLRITLGEDLTDAFLRILIRQSDRSGVRFPFDLYVRAVVRQYLFGRFIAEICDEFDKFVFLCASELRHFDLLIFVVKN